MKFLLVHLLNEKLIKWKNNPNKRVSIQILNYYHSNVSFQKSCACVGVPLCQLDLIECFWIVRMNMETRVYVRELFSNFPIEIGWNSQRIHDSFQLTTHHTIFGWCIQKKSRKNSLLINDQWPQRYYTRIQVYTGEHKDPANVISPTDEFITLPCNLVAYSNDSCAFLDLCFLFVYRLFFRFLILLKWLLTEPKENTKQKEIR